MADKQLQMVADWERDKEDKLANVFQQAQQHVQMNRQKLQSLEQYRLDYLRQSQVKAKLGVGAISFGQYQSFIGKLDKACEQQSRLLSNAILVAEQRKTQWLKQQRKRKAVEMLLDKKKLIRLRHEERVEQQMLDEISLQKFLRAQ